MRQTGGRSGGSGAVVTLDRGPGEAAPSSQRLCVGSLVKF